MFVKICGLSTAAAVQAAVDGGADALGFVFAESVRRVRPYDAAVLCRDVPAEIGNNDVGIGLVADVGCDALLAQLVVLDVVRFAVSSDAHQQENLAI